MNNFAKRLLTASAVDMMPAVQEFVKAIGGKASFVEEDRSNPNVLTYTEIKSPEWDLDKLAYALKKLQHVSVSVEAQGNKVIYRFTDHD